MSNLSVVFSLSHAQSPLTRKPAVVVVYSSKKHQRTHNHQYSPASHELDSNHRNNEWCHQFLYTCSCIGLQLSTVYITLPSNYSFWQVFISKTCKFPATPTGVDKLEMSIFRMVLWYWQMIISFCHNTHIWQTDGQHCDLSLIHIWRCRRRG